MTYVFHQGALGDFAVTLPMVQWLAGQRPVRVIADASKAALAARLIEGVHAFDGQRREFTLLYAVDGAERIAATMPDVAREFAQAKLLVSFVSRGDDAWAVNWRKLAPQCATFFLRLKEPADWPGHVTQWHRFQLTQQGIMPLPEWPMNPANIHPQGPVVIHPGSAGRNKCWPVDRFEKLMQALRSRGMAVQPVLGEVEAEQWPEALRVRWESEFAARVLLRLSELAEVLQSARLFIGNDSGPSHLAAFMGKPTIAMFGPTSPVSWGPRGPLVTILAPREPAAMGWLDVETVMMAAGVGGDF